MNEVSYLGEDLDLVTEFNNLKDKKSVSWSDEKYTHIRKTILITIETQPASTGVVALEPFDSRS